MAVNKRRVRALVNALRSGKFKQTKKMLGKLNADGSEEFCCLGVACVIAKRNGVRVNKTIGNRKDGDAVFKFANQSGTLPSTVRRWFGFEGHNPELRIGLNHFDAASVLNDEMDYSFKEIADAFENTFLKPKKNND